MATQGNKNAARTIVTTAALLAGGIAVYLFWHSRPGYEIEPGFMTVEKAYLSHESGMMAEVHGRVVRILRDEREGVHRQRFVIRLPNGQMVIVIHNVEDSDRVPVRLEDPVLVRGQYEWEESGGVLHWTHRDSSPNRRHGWVEHMGRRYD